MAWHQPYLETCCRAALHRLVLAGPLGRPQGLADQTCLTRLAAQNLTQTQAGRWHTTHAGRARHASEILHVQKDAKR